ncbi:MAG: TIGR01777 family oxidoreductase [Planctomycetota bacterium]
MSAARGKVVIAGGTGFLGRNLAVRLLELGHEVVVLGRSAPSTPAGTFVPWDGHSLGPWTDALRGCAALVNLAGRTVDCRKTPEHRDEILRSRVESTTALGRALEAIGHAPPVWVQMSTAHIYGDPPERVCDEQAAFGEGLAPDVGRAWEAAHEAALPPGTRSVVLRTSFVLGRGGGALPTLARLVRLRMGGRIGHGRQGISWIHERDMNGLFERALTDDSMRGAYLATAPQPVSNAEFMRELRRALGVSIGLPAARWMVRLGAPLLGTDPELAILGRYCRSRRLADEGFGFAFPDLRSALGDLFG